MDVPPLYALLIPNSHPSLKGQFAMNARPKLLYPALIVAAVAVTLLSATGIAALTGHLPSANAANSDDGSRLHVTKAEEGEAVRDRGYAPPACKTCGVVESVRAVEVKGQGSGLGAVAGGLAGALVGNQIGDGNGRTVATIAGAGGGAYLGNEIEKNKNARTSYQIRVRMDGGGFRTLYQHDAPSVATGDRVRISNGIAVLAS